MSTGNAINAATAGTAAGNNCGERISLILEMGCYPLQCTLPPGHPGDHYDAAFSRAWISEGRYQ